MRQKENDTPATDFQDKTANCIVEMFQNGKNRFQKGRNRVLLADEVGLGKTIVAKEVIKNMQEKEPKLKVVYFCPSESIARQNVLKLTDQNVFNRISEYRLSMLHLKLAEHFNQEKENKENKQNKENEQNKEKQLFIIPMTPETSLKMSQRQGSVEERALLFCVLNDYFKQYPCPKKKREKELNRLLNYNTDKDNWDKLKNYYNDKFTEYKEYYEKKHFTKKIKEELEKTKYFEGIYTANYKQTKFNWKEATLERFFSYLFSTGNPKLDDSICRDVIFQLRRVFAQISCNLLQSDFLIIMDEFQRYNDLLKKDSDSDSVKNDLKQTLLKKKRVLLLSATPYKPFYTEEELESQALKTEKTDGDLISKEFKEIIEFLLGSEANAFFEDKWNPYAQSMNDFCKNPSDNNFNKAEKCKREVEKELQNYICRTERYNGIKSQNESEQRKNNFISSDQVKSVKISKKDVQSWINIKSIVDNVKASMTKPMDLPVDFVKSSPYLMSFMGWVIKKTSDKKTSSSNKKNQTEAFYAIFAPLYRQYNKRLVRRNKQIINSFKKDNTSFINQKSINNFKSLVDRDGNANNARLTTLFDTILPKGNHTERLLWVPASRPYYKASGEQYPIGDIFSKNVGFSKVLLFSHWKMVPPMIASLVSYESDSRLYNPKSKGKSELSYKDFLEKKSRLNKSCVELLKYPSDYLASLDIRSLVPNLTLDEAMKVISRKIKTDLQNRINDQNSSDNDKQGDELSILEFNDQSSWKDEPKDAPDNYRKILEFLDNPDIDQPAFPDDAAIVLAQLALASPAVCFLRTFKQRGWSDKKIRQLSFNKNNQKKDSDDNALSSKEIFNNAAANFANAFLSIFRQTSAQKILDIVYKRQNKRKRGRFWQIIKYCVEGNLQAVLDEFAFQCQSPMEFYQHFFSSDRSSNDEVTTSQSDSKQKMPFAIAHQGRIEIGTKKAFLKKEEENIKIRTGFARKYSASSTRDDSVLRNAFNSPFRPFVLASTSIGQEGLDFHAYCRKIMHWNLPSNPIDLEQREGRINRYMSLAIRQSLANSSYADNAALNDFWTNLIKIVTAGKDSKALCGGMVPYWVLPDDEEFENPQFPIERIVPMYPYSKDQNKYEWIIKVLSRYRLTLGQPNQEELLRSLDNANIPEEQLKKLFFNLSPFFRNRKRIQNRES